MHVLYHNLTRVLRPRRPDVGLRCFVEEEKYAKICINSTYMVGRDRRRNLSKMRRKDSISCRT